MLIKLSSYKLNILTESLVLSVLVRNFLSLKRYSKINNYKIDTLNVDEMEYEFESGVELHDLHRPFEGDCKVEILTFEDAIAKTVIF